MKSLKVGIVGCGLITSHKYIPGFKKAGVNISAVCDLNEELVKTFARENSIAKFYTDLNQMLNENDFDLISICTPPGTHGKLGALVLKSGSHLLIEKPMALTVEECDQLLQEAETKGKKICVGHSDLFYPPIIKAKELVDKGYIGEFRGMRVLLSTPVDYAISNQNHWINKLPGGILGETGPHTVYLTTAFIRNIHDVKIMTKKNFSFEWTDYDDIRMELKGENGVSSIAITHSTDQWDAKVDIFGTKRSLYIDMHELLIQEHKRKRINAFSVGKAAVNKNFVSMVNIGKIFFLHSLSRINYGHELLIQKFVDSIVKNTPSPVSPESGREVIRIMEMILKNV